MEGFEAYREAARTGIESAGAEPVMAEEWPSKGHSSRTACLDLVASADALIIIVGERGGWTAPSGLLVVEEELHEARKRKLPVRVFVQESVKRDADAEQLVDKVSDYVDGYFRRTFTTPESLSAEVQRSLSGIPPVLKDSMSSSQTDVRILAKAVDESDQAHSGGTARKTLRFVLAPERSGEVIDPRRLDHDEFQHAVMSAAQAPLHRLLEYGQAVAPVVRGTALILERTGPEPSWRERRPARIEIHENGIILIDVPLENPQDSTGTTSIPGHIINEDLVRSAISSAFKFSKAIYDLIDKYRRHERFKFDVVLTGVDGSVLERAPKPRTSYSIPFRQGHSGPVMPLESPRTVNRHDLEKPDDEVDRLVTYLRRILTA